MIARFAKVPDDSPAMAGEKEDESSSGSSSGSESETDDSADERARKLSLLQEQVFCRVICVLLSPLLAYDLNY